MDIKEREANIRRRAGSYISGYVLLAGGWAAILLPNPSMYQAGLFLFVFAFVLFSFGMYFDEAVKEKINVLRNKFSW